MTLTSPLEDLKATTLKAIAGSLRRLEYLSGLRNTGGTYAHWGLARVYGDSAATRALARAHRSLVSQILSTPLRQLLEDIEKSSEVAGVPPKTYLKRLCDQSPDLLPPEPGAGAGRHLNSVLHALSSLSRH
jgi:hypothetical protein